MSEPARAPFTDDTRRRRILAAAIDCILERGFYRASSNEIARRAGMTWGAIQYYFGTRERLMLAALDVFNGEFEAMLQAATSDDDTGRPTAERLERLGLLLAHQYARPQYFAALQIVLNLSHNPETSEETAAALVESENRLSALMRSLITRAVGPGADPATISLAFHAFRGLAVSHLISSEASPQALAGPRRIETLQADARRLAQALALQFDAEQAG